MSAPLNRSTGTQSRTGKDTSSAAVADDHRDQGAWGNSIASEARAASGRRSRQ